MSGYFQKTATETRQCRIDWREGYLRDSEKIARDLGWSIAAPDGKSSARIVDSRNDQTSSFARVCGGEANTVYMLIAEAETSSGRHIDRAVALRIV